jgi:hypothetical protein
VGRCLRRWFLGGFGAVAAANGSRTISFLPYRRRKTCETPFRRNPRASNLRFLALRCSCASLRLASATRICGSPTGPCRQTLLFTHFSASQTELLPIHSPNRSIPRFPSEIPPVPQYRHIPCSDPQTPLLSPSRVGKSALRRPTSRDTSPFIDSLHILHCTTTLESPVWPSMGPVQPPPPTTCLSPVLHKGNFTHLVGHTVPLSHTTSSGIPGRRMCVSLRGSPKSFHMCPFK